MNSSPRISGWREVSYDEVIRLSYKFKRRRQWAIRELIERRQYVKPTLARV